MKFDLTVDEANLVLSALGRMPYESVFQLVAKLQEQAQEHTQEAE